MKFYKFYQSLKNENDLSTEVLINNNENKNFIILKMNDLKFGLGMPSLQLYAGVSSVQTISAVSSAGLKLGIKTSSFAGK